MSICHGSLGIEKVKEQVVTATERSNKIRTEKYLLKC